MEIVKNTIKNVLNNQIIKGLLVLFVILYASQISPPLPDFLKNFFNNPMGKGLLIFLIVFYINKGKVGIGLSILLVILYALLINVNNAQNVIETYSSYISNNILKGGSNENYTDNINENQDNEYVNYEDINNNENVDLSESELDKTINEIIHNTNDNTDNFMGGVELEEQELEAIRLDERKLGNEQQIVERAFKDTQAEIKTLAETYNLDKEILESNKKYKSVIEKHKKYDTNTDKTVNYLDKNPNIKSNEDVFEEEQEQEDIPVVFLQDGGANLFNIEEETTNKKTLLGGLNIEKEFGEAINDDDVFKTLGGSNIKPYQLNELATLE